MLEFIQKELLNAQRQLGFRGQRCSSWSLSPTLARFLERLKKKNRIHESATYETVERQIKDEFRKNLLLNQDLTPEQLQRIDLWQYGQHFGLPTPLLDWTRSAYVALFFSLVGDPVIDELGVEKPRSLWVLDMDLLELINHQIKNEVWQREKDHLDSEKLLTQQIPTMDIVGEVDGYNRRIGYQQGFFTKHVFYVSFESWARRIASEVAHECWDVPLLQQLNFSPTEMEKTELLVALDKMNINSRTLFPDITGSVEQTCFMLEHALRRDVISFSGTTLKK